MNSPPAIFAQVIAFLSMHEFLKCIQRYRWDYRVRKFSCLDQFFCLAFAQLTNRESLRDVEYFHQTMESRFYFMGIHGRVTRTNLAGANKA